MRLQTRAAIAVLLATVAAIISVGPAKAAPARPIAAVSITPTSVEAGTVGHVFDITYQVGNAAFRGQAGTQIPAGWTRPQAALDWADGYVSVVPGSCSKVSLRAVSDSTTGPWIVALNANCKANETFGLRYRSVAAHTAAGPHTFASGSVLNNSSSIQPVSPQPIVTVLPGPAASLAVEGYPSPATAGSPAAATVVGVDRYGNRNAPLAGDVSLSSTDTAASFPAAAPLVDGAHSFPDITLRTAGSQSITATSATTPSITGTQAGIAVEPGPLARIELSPADATLAAGEPQAYTAEGFDAFGNTRGPVTPTLTMAPDGTCDALTCTSASPGAKTVTATLDGLEDTAVLTATNQVITVLPETVANAVVGESYRQQLEADGALGGATFAADPDRGTLPPGLALSTDGVLSGSPTATGAFRFVVVATDGNGVTGERAYDLSVVEALTATPSPADFGTVAVTNHADQTITVTNHGTRSISFNFVGVDNAWHFQSFGGCFGTTLAPGATCTQTPRFAPDSEGFHNGTFRLGWYDTADSSRTGMITVPMTGIATAEMTVAPSPADFGTVAVTNHADQTITVTNHGSRSISFNFVGVDNDWHFQSFAGCFGTTLAPGATCTQTPRFAPDNEGFHTGTFRLGWYDTAQTSRTGTITVPMTGIATAEMTVAPSPADFGTVAVTNHADETITVTNHGTRSITFNFVGVDNDWHFQSFAGCFGTTLAPGGTCTQTPRFAPDNEGIHTGTFRLGWYDTAQTSRTGTITVPMRGVAVDELAATPAPADFGSVAVTNSSDQTITITNNGTKSVTFNFVGVDDDWHFPSFAGCFGTTLAPGGTCTQTPRFRPDNEGIHNGTLRLGWYDSTQTSRTGTITVPMTGFATPELTAAPSPADFGDVAVGSSSDRTITITNHGARSITFNFVGVDDDWHFPSFAGCFGTTLAPGGTCTQTPRFAPNDEGPHAGTFRLGWYDSAQTSRTGTITVPMRGYAHGELGISPGYADFGSVAVTSSSDRTLTITNHGTQTVMFNFVGVDDDWHFASFAGCFGTALAPGATCTQTPRFRPDNEGPHTGTFRLGWYDTADSSRTGTLTATLLGTATPELTATPNPFAFGSVAVGEVGDQVITVTNNGSRTLTFNFVGVDDDWHFTTFAGCFGTNLAPGATCTQQVRFQPDNEGAHTGTFRLGWYDSSQTSRTGTLSVPMTGYAP